MSKIEINTPIAETEVDASKAMAFATVPLEHTPDDVFEGVPIFGGKLADLDDDINWQFNLSIGRSQEEKKWMMEEMSFGGFLLKLFTHKESKKKNGPCFMQGSLVPGVKQRTLPNVFDLNFMVLDIDSGQPMAEVRQELINQDLLGVLYTTYSHGTTSTKIKKTEMIKKLHLDDGDEITTKHVKFYLQHHKRYDKRIIDTCQYVKEEHVEGGVMVFVDHDPMPKYRIVLPLAETFVLSEVTGGNEHSARELWKRKYVGLAHRLGASYDRSCTDISRLFFWPTHAPGGEHAVELVIGDFLDLNEVEEADPKELDRSNPFTEAGVEGGDLEELETPWLRSFMKGKWRSFAAGEFFSSYYDVRNVNGDKITTECPFDGGHSNAGDPEDQGFFSVDGDGEKSFAARCSHDSCADYKKLHFVDQAIQEFNLTEEDLAEFIPEGVEEVDDAPADNLDALLSALPPSADVEKLPLEQVEEIMQALALRIANGDTSAWVKVFDVLQPYGHSKKALMALMNAAKKKISAKASADGGNDRADDKLKKINEEYAVVYLNGHVKIVNMKDPNGYSFMSDASLKILLANERIPKGDSQVSLVDEWLRWKGRRTFWGVEFAPAGGREDYLNLFNGFAFDGKRGGDQYGDGWELLEEHIFENVCHENQDWYHWFMTWLADIIQNPKDKKGSCILLRGEQGVGKSIVFDLFRELLGKSALKIDSMERLTGRFNSCLSGNLFAQLEEGFFAGKHSDKSKMKNLVTGSSLFIERKGVEGWEEQNYTRVAMTSNDDWLMSMTRDDRRYFVLECKEDRQNDTRFFESMWDQMRNGGFEAWMYDLQHWKPDDDSGGWAMLRKPPHTPWTDDQITLSMRPEEKFFELWNAGDAITASFDTTPIQRNAGKTTEVDLPDFSAHFDAFMKANSGSRQLIGNPKALNKLCQRFCPGFDTARVSAGEGKKKRVYCFPALECEPTGY
jgi:hypothetical protein